MGSAELAQLSFRLAEKRLDKQEAALEELRARTGVLLAASSLAASFLGKDAFQGSGLEGGQEEVHRRLAYDLDRFWEQNDLRMRRLRRGFEIAAAGLIIEVVALVALVADTIA